MADFARFGVAVERAVGWPRGTFLATYGANREAAHDLTLEASLVAGPLRDFVWTVGAWTGTATALLATLAPRVGEPISRKREWPKTPTALGGQLAGSPRLCGPSAWRFCSTGGPSTARSRCSW